MITSNCTNHVFLRVFCAVVCVCPISCSAVSLSVLTVIRPESRVTEAAVASLFLSFCLSLSLFSAVSLCPSDRLCCCPVVFTTDQWLRVTVLSLQQNETNIDNTSNHSMTRLITLHFCVSVLFMEVTSDLFTNTAAISNTALMSSNAARAYLALGPQFGASSPVIFERHVQVVGLLLSFFII